MISDDDRADSASDIIINEIETDNILLISKHPLAHRFRQLFHPKPMIVANLVSCNTRNAFWSTINCAYF